MNEREIVTPVDLTTADGRLAPGAIGFSRRPLHRCAIPGPWGRRKRWDYWCVTTSEGALCLTYADFDYLGLVDVSFVDFASGRVASAPAVVPFAIGFRQPDTVGGGDIVFRAPHLRLAIREAPDGTRLLVHAWTPRGRIEADVVVHRPPAEESLNVVVPFGTGRFQFTSKQVALPATGEVRAFGRRHPVDAQHDGFACLDYGRGVWPTRIVWNWGTAAGYTHTARGRQRLGVQLGGQWTDGTGMTENGILLDGRLHKLDQPLRWRYDPADVRKPWSVSDDAGAVALTFVPVVARRLAIDLGIARSRLHLCFGHWHGTVRVEGQALEVARLPGWAEDHRARW